MKNLRHLCHYLRLAKEKDIAKIKIRINISKIMVRAIINRIGQIITEKKVLIRTNILAKENMLITRDVQKHKVGV